MLWNNVAFSLGTENRKILMCSQCAGKWQNDIHCSVHLKTSILAFFRPILVA